MPISTRPLQLTPQQQAVVQHDDGPALVFAVAGAGKTTTMVHRIHRLVTELDCPPKEILATSFARANARDLQEALAQWPVCRPVVARTLHALGRDIIVSAQQLGYATQWRLNGINGGNDQIGQQLLNQAIAFVHKQKLSFQQELDSFDRADFLDYVGSCKGNLAYADLTGAQLPSDGRRRAQQARPPSEELAWYLDLYKVYEQVRLAQGGVTFDDMLLTGWELLVAHPELLTQIQSRYRYVLVDEFQDINYAQAEMLDLLTQQHRNYMAIGDDDQTVYEWRGADPNFILDFPKRYQAQTYVMNENFRCPAGPLTLANEVIQHNRKRQPKRLHLTQGFVGETTFTFNPSLEEMAEAMAAQILRLRQNNVSLDEIAVLVRLNAQTPPLEQALISRQISYRSASPFYARSEIQTLVQYGRLAWAEKQLLAGEQLREGALTQALQAWRHIVNRPKRYISTNLGQRMTAVLESGNRSWSQTALEFSELVGEEWLQEKLRQLAQDLRWLAENLDQDASQTLRQLEMRLQYKRFLQGTSGLAQTGSDRAAGVDALIAYAAGHGSLQTFFGHIRQLEQEATGLANSSSSPAVTLSTIHRAKGLEWSYVFIPQCNQGTLPFTGQEPVNLEEERRLFYVALTRARRSAYLFAVKGEPVSQFLSEGAWLQTLRAVKDAQRTLRQPPEQWPADDVRTLARHSFVYHWQSYFQDWWDGPETAKATIAAQMTATLQGAREARMATKNSPSAATDSPAAQPDETRGKAKIVHEGKNAVKIELDGQIYTWNKRIKSWYDARYLKPPTAVIQQLEDCLGRRGLRR